MGTGTYFLSEKQYIGEKNIALKSDVMETFYVKFIYLLCLWMK